MSGTALPVTRIRGRKRSVKKKGYVIARVPRNWPPAECYATYEGTSHLVLPSTVWDNSPWQLFCFRNTPDQQQSSCYTLGGVSTANASPTAVPTIVFRNLSGATDLRTLYNYGMILGITYEVRWTKFTSNSPHFVGYMWESTEYAKTSHLNNDDRTEPVLSPLPLTVLDKDTSPWRHDAVNATLGALSQSRRVTQIHSSAPKDSNNSGARTDMSCSFYLDLTKTRRRAYIPRSDYKSTDLTRYGAYDTLAKAESALGNTRVGYRNQVNIAVAGSHMQQDTSVGVSHFDNMTVNVKVKILHYDRK